LSVDEFGCDVATGRLDRDGYAFRGKSRAHIVAWVERNGPVPHGKEIEHTCRNRACRSWWHLEAVTRSENELRKSFAYRARRERCQMGHDLRANRVLTPNGGIVCMQCNRQFGGVK
jgi:hypothetical protein